MPNFPMSNPIQHHLRQQVERLSERSCAQVRSLFPLDHQEVQDLVLDRATCAVMQGLIDKGVKTIDKCHELRIAFFGAGHESDRHIPELKRSIVLKIDTRYDRINKSGWFVKYFTQYGIYDECKFDINSNQYIVADLSLLSPERRAKLIHWLDVMLKQERMKEVAVNVSNEIIFKHAATTTHLQVLFPALCKIVDAVDIRGNRNGYLEGWVEKLRNPARNLYNYIPPAWVEATYKPLFPVVEAMLNSGKLIGHDIKPDLTKIQAEIEHWQRLEKDVKFPLPRKEPKPIEYGITEEKIQPADIDNNQP